MGFTFVQPILRLLRLLLASGAGQWVRGHWVAASALCYGFTLEFVLSSATAGKAAGRTPREIWTPIAFELVDYFAKGAVGKVLVTLITTIQAMFSSSFRVGAAALVACALCYFGTAGFVGSWRAKRIKDYKATDLLGIGTVAVVLNAAGIALMLWCSFWINAFGIEVQGLYWVVAGIIIAALTTKREHAL
jgi:hypothetical protein